MKVGDVAYDHSRGLLKKDGVVISLGTSKLRDVWFFFLTNKNKVITEGQIRNAIYGGYDRGEQAIRQFIQSIRRALRVIKSHCRIISWGSRNWELVTKQGVRGMISVRNI